MSKFGNTRYHSGLKLRSVNIQWYQAIDNGRPQRQGRRNASRIPMTDKTEHVAKIPTESRNYCLVINKSVCERAEFAFSIYDTDGTNVIDAVDLGNVLRALNLNPTNATIEKLGGTKKKGEKKMKLDEFLPVFSQCKKDKDQGCYEDFLECLKLYDKQENGTMLGAELSHTLLSLGERLNDGECDEVIKDCMDPEDDDGFIPYAPFLKKMMVLL